VHSWLLVQTGFIIVCLITLASGISLPLLLWSIRRDVSKSKPNPWRNPQ
jgi:hypothetical protein